jgi:hypothetical protein
LVAPHRQREPVLNLTWFHYGSQAGTNQPVSRVKVRLKPSGPHSICLNKVQCTCKGGTCGTIPVGRVISRGAEGKPRETPTARDYVRRRQRYVQRLADEMYMCVCVESSRRPTRQRRCDDDPPTGPLGGCGGMARCGRSQNGGVFEQRPGVGHSGRLIVSERSRGRGE